MPIVETPNQIFGTDFRIKLIYKYNELSLEGTIPIRSSKFTYQQVKLLLDTMVDFFDKANDSSWLHISINDKKLHFSSNLELDPPGDILYHFIGHGGLVDHQ